ncbi:hypothetical protein LRP50_25075 [Enterovibrio sp. ZSDZ42]|uniref:HEPN AbiU2-like domain-containing protein n=1 Tax=Enterovibrio gelatinilyticus TaxID=2899819 RepID=A0ABT5R8U9_9GAMM|nr:hypothetical protein [Enterovibrio sp. ZSDZ42]MDD1796394.1 hypothetical protein [Enterovibrio sp. ZSDZ42]
MAKSEILIPVGDAATALGILETKILQWVKEDSVEVKVNYRGISAIPRSYISTCSQKPDYYQALVNSIAVENEHKERVLSTDERERLNHSRINMLETYKSWIDRLEVLHREYQSEINDCENESWELACYLLLSRAIGLLKGAAELLSQGFWYAGSIIREIDETLDVAQCFKIQSEKGEHNDLQAWFRNSVAPSHSKCRKIISANYAELITETDAHNHELLLNELYRKKSKWTHPNFGVIREAGSFKTEKGKFIVSDLCYGECVHEFKMHELVDFFKSSIWSSYQQFMIIFVNILSIEHRQELLEFDRLQQRL